ncbi:MAG TPA: hypothetical protein VFN53_13225 [Acidobacteriaceae bacterium]|nr:hypothetical protein [Acidobacteriaceae bacterium]
MSFPLPPDALEKKLVFEFFWKFSVLEFALKRAGYLKKDRENAEPDWIRFSKEIAGCFQALQLDGFQQAASDLRELSPKRQINKNGALSWKQVPRFSEESEAEYTLRFLKIVRDNLFHGGRYPEGPVFEIARNQKILRTALTILDGCYELYPGIQPWIAEAAA